MFLSSDAEVRVLWEKINLPVRPSWFSTLSSSIGYSSVYKYLARRATVACRHSQQVRRDDTAICWHPLSSSSSSSSRSIASLSASHTLETDSNRLPSPHAASARRDILQEMSRKCSRSMRKDRDPTALPRTLPTALLCQLQPWPWSISITLTFNPRRAMAVTGTLCAKVKVEGQLVQKIEWKQTDGPDRSHYHNAVAKHSITSASHHRPWLRLPSRCSSRL